MQKNFPEVLPLLSLALPPYSPQDSQTTVGSKKSFEHLEMKQSLWVVGRMRMLFAKNLLSRNQEVFSLYYCSALVQFCFPGAVGKPSPSTTGLVPHWRTGGMEKKPSPPLPRMLYSRGHRIVTTFEVCSQNAVCVLIWVADQNSTLKMFFECLQVFFVSFFFFLIK